MPIIRRNNCIYVTLGTCYSVWYAGANAPAYQTSHPPRVTNTKCHINTVISADNGHIIAQNMYRKEINILRKTVNQVGFIYKITHIILFIWNIPVGVSRSTKSPITSNTLLWNSNSQKCVACDWRFCRTSQWLINTFTKVCWLWLEVFLIFKQCCHHLHQHHYLGFFLWPCMTNH